MTILLTILKIIGIILLVILGLVLLILLLVLFTPICYRIDAVHNDSVTRARARIRFLVISGFVLYEKGIGLDYYVKLLFFKIIKKEEKTSETEEEEFDALDDFLENEDAKEESNTSNALQQKDKNDDNDSLESEENQQNTGSADILDETDNDESSIEYDTLKKKNKKKKKDKKKKENKIPFKERINNALDLFVNKIDEFLDKADKKIDEVDKSYNEKMTKLDHVTQFLDREYVQRTIKRALKVLKRLLGTIKPKKSKGYLKLGLKSSADTGMMLGKIAAFYPLYARWLTIEPDFYHKVIEGDIDIKGRIYLFRFILPVLRILISRDFWKTYKLAKKI